jgi:DNA-binding GntR family transcriptional regulator
MNADPEQLPDADALLGQVAIGKDARTLGANISNALRDAIISGKLAPGQALGQEYLARVFGVSRVPVRESLKQLAAEGLVVVEPHKGAVVARLSVEELDELYGIIWALEEAAVRVAVPRLTDAQIAALERAMEQMERVSEPVEWYRVSVSFHRMILVASGWQRCVRIVDECRKNIGRYIMEERFFLAHVDDWRSRNRGLLEACRARDPDAAVQALEVMRRLSTAQIREHLRQAIHVPGD